MLKYLVSVFVLMMLAAIAFYAYFYMGFFIDFRPNATVHVVFRADDNGIYKDDSEEPLLLRGVEIISFVPGQSYWELGAKKKDYLRWFEQIEDMGATVVYAANIMHSSFYDALYQHNKTSENGLMLIQGVGDTHYHTDSEELSQSLRKVIDIIHGNRIDLLNENGIQVFMRDISPWVVGFVVGAEWNPDAIAYINNNVDMPDSFQGSFFSTSEDANRFEAMLAQVMDSATSYETRRFKTQRPISFIANPLTDFLEYEIIYAAQLRKYVQTDYENIIPSEDMQAGVFAAYRLFHFTDDFLSLLTPNQKSILAPLLDDLDINCNFNGYLDLLTRYHTMPVVAVGFGISASRVPTRIDDTPYNERQQGEGLAMISTQLETKGWAGNIISTWQDNWERRTWNTAFATDPWRNQYWRNLQSQTQGYGLMSFDPGAYSRPVLIDGSPDEWDESHLVHTDNSISIYAKQSVEGLYLLVRGNNVSPGSKMYLPIMVTPKSGTSIYEHLEFARPSNFLLILNGETNTRLMVNMRSNATFMRFHEEITGENPFAFVPSRWESEFVPILIAQQNNLIFNQHELLTITTRRLFSRETGLLTHGINDPAHDNFNSLADFCYGDNLVEIRLPWMMLNFFDPSTTQVHDDYYDKFGVEGLPISDIYIGIARTDSDYVAMSPVRLKPWRGNLQFHERLKLSYFIMQEAWRQ
ncbi:MAG: hypothetical protein FWC73_01615 [Defluviitaleaceae bacterium]|nr:hypothetical protein [Defluviitaleaceae bacterium]